MNLEPAPVFSVLVMAYNEAENLESVVRELDEVLRGLKQPFELVIIDDGSSDGTGNRADELTRSIPHVRVIHHPQNLGLGGVYRTGFTQARGTFISFFPADGQFPATILNQFAPLIENLELVLGYLPNQKRSLLGRFLSFVERVLYRVLFGTFPRFQGVLMIRREVISKFTLKSEGRGWAVLMELILRIARAGLRIQSVPTEMRPRLSGQSKVNNFRTIWANFKQVLALRRLL